VRVGLLWRAEWDPVVPGTEVARSCKLHGVFAAFAALGVEAEPVVYSDETVDEARAQLLGLDGVLVWVNPIEQGRDRSTLDPLLREAAAAGVWVSAHPDVILKIGTKQVLVDTRHMSWSAETHLYSTVGELREQLPERLAARGPLVLKQHRGMGGEGVWKVELMASDGAQPHVVVQHAAAQAAPERLPLDAFLARCEPYFAGPGLMVEQPFQPRLAEGMLRAYLTHDKVVGFTHQFPRGLMPPGPDDRPTTKLFEPPSEPRYGELRERLESEWVPQLQATVGVETHSLPVIWDADFLFGPKTPSGEDTYVLCEINASSTFAFPEHAMPTVARAAIDRIRDRS
jgi:hypothetical protein